MGVGPGRDHHDWYVARPADGPAYIEAVDSGKHDIDQNYIGRFAGEGGQSALAGVSFHDVPALVFEGHADGRSDSFVVLDSQYAGSHGP